MQLSNMLWPSKWKIQLSSQALTSSSFRFQEELQRSSIVRTSRMLLWLMRLSLWALICYWLGAWQLIPQQLKSTEPIPQASQSTTHSPLNSKSSTTSNTITKWNFYLMTLRMSFVVPWFIHFLLRVASSQVRCVRVRMWQPRRLYVSRRNWWRIRSIP